MFSIVNKLIKVRVLIKIKPSWIKWSNIDFVLGALIISTSDYWKKYLYFHLIIWLIFQSHGGSQEGEELQQFECPKCNQTCPDMDTLQIHVLDCIDQDMTWPTDLWTADLWLTDLWPIDLWPTCEILTCWNAPFLKMKY